MKNGMLAAFLFLVTFASLPLYAQEATAPAPAAAPEVAAAPAPVAEDPLKDVVVHTRPADFETAQQLAIQNRQERLELVQRAMECVQHAKTINDIYACQEGEKKTLDLIRLSYCDTSVSYLIGRQKKNPLIAPPKVKMPSECELALSVVTGKPLPQAKQ